MHLNNADIDMLHGPLTKKLLLFTLPIALSSIIQLKLCLNKTGLSFSITKQILKSGIPSAMQGAVFCFANIFVQASINTFGETAIAGSTIAMNFEYFTYYVITAFGQTTTTFTSQNFAARQKARCKKNILVVPFAVGSLQFGFNFCGCAFQKFFCRYFFHTNRW